MARDGTLPLTEPMVVPEVMAEVVFIEMRDEMVRLVCAADYEKTEQGGMERRIVARLAMPRSAAAALALDLRRLLAQGSH